MRATVVKCLIGLIGFGFGASPTLGVEGCFDPYVSCRSEMFQEARDCRQHKKDTSPRRSCERSAKEGLAFCDKMKQELREKCGAPKTNQGSLEDLLG